MVYWRILGHEKRKTSPLTWYGVDLTPSVCVSFNRSQSTTNENAHRSLYIYYSITYTHIILFNSFQVYECEFFVLETMTCCLILYHPYRSLVQYVKDINEDDNFLSLAWRIVNDSLRTDVCLIYPPYQIALAAVYMACVVRQRDASDWFKELCVDMDKILEITQEVLKLYEILKSYDEKKDMQAILAKAPKPKTSSRPPSAAGSNSQYLSHSPVVSSQGSNTPRWDKNKIGIRYITVFCATGENIYF